MVVVVQVPTPLQHKHTGSTVFCAESEFLCFFLTFAVKNIFCKMRISVTGGSCKYVQRTDGSDCVSGPHDACCLLISTAQQSVGQVKDLDLQKCAEHLWRDVAPETILSGQRWKWWFCPCLSFTQTFNRSLQFLQHNAKWRHALSHVGFVWTSRSG